MGSSNIRKPITVLLSLALAGTLAACGGTADTAQPSLTPAPPRSGLSAAGDIPGEVASDVGTDAGEQEGAPWTPGEGDGLEGTYYNDYLRQTLTLDGMGGCVIASADGETGGTYVLGNAGLLTLNLDTGEEAGSVDLDGDILILGRTGYYLRDWGFWGITSGEIRFGQPVPAGEASVTDNGDGTLRVRDFDNAIAFTCPSNMEVLSGKLIGGTAAGSREGGYVTGRNVTDLYSTHNGSDDEFLTDYVRTFVFTDFGILYDGVRGFEPITLLHEGVDGRLAAATLSISDGTRDVAVKVLLYTSTYPDGSVNRICKTIFAPAEREGGIDALEAAVTNMSAVRLVAE